MITDEANSKSSSHRKTVKISDHAIVWGGYSSGFSKMLFQKTWDEFITWLVWLVLRFNKAVSAMQMWCVARFKPGSQTLGITAFAYAWGFAVGYNSMQIHWVFKPFSALIIPFMLFGKSWPEIYQFLAVNVESQLLAGYIVLFSLCCLIHIVMIWMGKGSDGSMSRRGQSWIGLALSKFMSVNEFFICGIVEPLIYICVGVSAWYYLHDGYFGSYMIIIALAEASQQILDKAYDEHTKSVLKA
ncbi:MAG: hypothetical protein R8G66_02810 [Cytophagales bacterium]|nr:hypothetical protein [Cytophagales bacterium]